MIPKTIHYCWFGRNPLPKLAKKCIKSWKKHCPDYEIIEWNEDNFDIASAPLYVRQAYEAKKWAFVTDYVRLYVVYEHGGIYMDTDVELIKNLDPLLQYDAYFGFEDGKYINSGLGFGAKKGSAILREMLDDYVNISFQKQDGSFDLKPCPVRNLEVFLRHGLKQDDSCQILEGNILILPTVQLCPYDGYLKPTGNIKEAYSIHWFSASWYDEASRQKLYSYRKSLQRDRLIHTPNRVLIKLLGQTNYNKLKKLLGRK